MLEGRGEGRFYGRGTELEVDFCVFSAYSIDQMKAKEIRGTPLTKSYSTNTFKPFRAVEYFKPSPRPSTRPTTSQDLHDITNTELFLSSNPSLKKQIPDIMRLISIPSCPPDPKKVTPQSLLSNEFPVLQYKVKDLIEFAKTILQTSQFCRINFPGKIVRKIVGLIADNYRGVAYHNFSHAFSLMMFNYQCLAKSFWLKYLYTEEEYFYVLIAGLAHDINHPGTSNGFQVRTKSANAVRYNSQSVLQNMHIAHLWSIIENHPQCNFLEGSVDKSKAKKIVTRLILNTDMSFHNKNLSSFHEAWNTKQFNPKQNSEHKWILMEQIFHACDIGNSCSQFQNYMNWNTLLVCQFAQIIQMEEQRGLEITKMLVFRQPKDVYKDQLWFVGNIVQPLWREIGLLCPDLAFLEEAIQHNLGRVKEELKKLE